MNTNGRSIRPRGSAQGLYSPGRAQAAQNGTEALMESEAIANGAIAPLHSSEEAGMVQDAAGYVGRTDPLDYENRARGLRRRSSISQGAFEMPNAETGKGDVTSNMTAEIGGTVLRATSGSVRRAGQVKQSRHERRVVMEGTASPIVVRGQVTSGHETSGAIPYAHFVNATNSRLANDYSSTPNASFASFSGNAIDAEHVTFNAPGSDSDVRVRHVAGYISCGDRVDDNRDAVFSTRRQ